MSLFVFLCIYMLIKYDIWVCVCVDTHMHVT